MEVSHIATAAEEQSSTVHGITGNIQQVTNIINDSAAGTQEFSTAAAGMHLMAMELKRIVNGFTIDENGHAPADAASRERSGAYLDQLDLVHA